MEVTVLFVTFALFVFASVPIGVAIGLALCCYSFFGGADIAQIEGYMFFSLNNFSMIAIPFFILAGSLMEGGGLSRRLINLSNACIGHLTGGLGMVTVLTCIFFGAISGSAVATVAAIGTIMIPAMEKQGYSRSFATALTASSGVLGTIIPPSIPMVMFCVTMPAASPGEMFMGGVGPGLLAGGALMVMVYIFARKNGYRGTDVPFSFNNIGEAALDAVWALFVPVIIIGGIYGGVFTATEASAVACLYGFIVGKFIYKELSIKKTIKSFVDSGVTVATILVVISTGAALGKVLTLEGIPRAIEAALLGVTDNMVIMLLIINLFLLFVGCIIETFTAIIVLSPILYPIAHSFGIDIYHFGVMMILNLSIGFITPPVGSNLFVACGITGMKFEKLVAAITPFLLALIIALLVVTFVPAVTTFLPNFLSGK